jgi:hypothetical protein
MPLAAAFDVFAVYTPLRCFSSPQIADAAAESFRVSHFDIDYYFRCRCFSSFIDIDAISDSFQIAAITPIRHFELTLSLPPHYWPCLSLPPPYAADTDFD